ncbi:MAG: HD domain-containing protein [Actinomycetota bacterium]|nr:HD domain-containing protein [Actinomycetota bacterium]
METLFSGSEHATPPLRVLIAERHRTVAQSLTHLVQTVGGAEVAAVAADPEETIEVGSKIAPDVAIVDLELSPNCALVAGLHKLVPSTRIIVLGSKNDDPSNMVNALASGAVGAIYKEASFDSLQRALSTSSRAAPVVAEETTGVLLSSYMDVLNEKRAKDLATIGALAAAVECRDATTGRHLERVTDLATDCISLIDPDMAGVEEVAYGFMLHDVGKIGIPDAILNKPGPLDESEWAIMRGHPEMGVRIVEPVGFSDKTTEIILCHHERYNGAGYPNRLKGEEIPLAARVFSVADAFDALTSDRPYRPAVSEGEALSVIRGSAGTHFDPHVVDVFLAQRKN